MSKKKQEQISENDLSNLSREGLSILKEKFGIELKLQSDHESINDILLDWDKLGTSASADYDRGFDKTAPGYDRAYDRDNGSREAT